MDPSSSFRDDALNDLLDRAAAPAPLSALMTDAALQEATRAARFEAARDVKSRLGRRLAISGVALALVLGGTGVAAAVTNFEWPSWAQQPDAAMQITLPSGAQCEYLIGNLQNADPEIMDAARAFFASAPVPTTAQVDARVVAVHGETLAQTPEGDRDRRYSSGVVGVMADELDADLQQHGFDSAQRPYFEGVITCEGTNQ
ncbi:hypothetical protein E3O11_16275 [Cryobacterium levicorallinum]|uniref:Uncharacterized protein n=1 Tax=Cryobacterium levicorallinum TaxID=995038 RepID=A0A1I3DAY5_9MICO|nr:MULTISPECIES: hypothetical protein [Cryobacterium]TFB81833.1 hypothetical protein E3O11_16275 [Cryobacterium levicorallinum]GEP28237.1 hypothetical protein CLE01_28350 [Cryobacterium levicorallinum]SFH83718.1 hypothetical protein SAMN05216274_11723 [Cryobacterium levicorallinum]